MAKVWRARLDAGRTELEAGRRQLEALRTQFSTELERAREAVTLAQERAEASERRSLRELDAERTAEELQGELAAALLEARDAVVAQAEGCAKLEAQAAAQRPGPRRAKRKRCSRASC